MLYSGKRPEDMTGDELEQAEAYVLRHLQLAHSQYNINLAAYQELAAEQSRREQMARKVN
jgi:hypothetical protein